MLMALFGFAVGTDVGGLVGLKLGENVEFFFVGAFVGLKVGGVVGLCVGQFSIASSGVGP